MFMTLLSTFLFTTMFFYVHLRFYDSHEMLLGFFVWVSVTVVFMIKVLLRIVFFGIWTKSITKRI